MLPAPDSTFSLLLAALRWPLGPDRLCAIAEQVTAEIDWQRFVDLANRHRAGPLAAHAVVAARVPTPEPFSAQFAQTQRNALFAEMTIVGEIGRVEKLLAGSGIRPVLLKGPELSLRAFGQLGLRTYRDLDFLIDEDAVTAAHACLIEASYDLIEPNGDAACGDLTGWRRDHKDAMFRHRETGLHLELHWRLFDNHEIMPVRHLATPVTLGLPPLEGSLVLPLEAELQYLCIHGALHGWSRLRWLADVNALITQSSADSLMLMSTRHVAVAQALILCRDLLGASFPPELDRRLSLSRRGRWLAKLAWSEIQRSGTQELESVPFGSTVKNLSHYALLSCRASLLEELRFDFTAQPRVGHRGSRLANWMARHLFHRSNRRANL